MSQDEPALWGKADARVRFVENWAANHELQPLHLRAYSRLAKPQTVSRPGKAAGFGHYREGPNDFGRNVRRLVTPMHRSPAQPKLGKLG